MKNLFCSLLVISGLVIGIWLLGIGDCFSAVPGMISYQGKLTNASGQLMDGQHSLTFKLFDALTGSTDKWEETHNDVAVTNGLFNVMLGSTNSLTTVFQENDSLYLEIIIGNETLSPRQRVASVGYAIKAGSSTVGGWEEASETWTYASADAPTYTFAISGDKTSKYSAGMKIKLTQTTDKYFIITRIAYSIPNTIVTVYGGTDYNLANAAITSPHYSTQKSPFGFPLSPSKWSVRVVDTGSRVQSSPTNNAWYNLGNTARQITIPIGVWEVYYKTDVWALATSGRIDVHSTLSTANNSASDMDFSVRTINSSLSLAGMLGTAKKVLTLTTKGVYYLNYKVAESTSPSSLGSDGTVVPTVIEATCAYL